MLEERDRMCTIAQMANLFKNDDNRYNLLNTFKAAMRNAKPFSQILLILLTSPEFFPSIFLGEKSEV